MSTATMTAAQIRYVNRAYWRNPSRAFLTFAFPLMLLVIFTALLGNGTIRIGTTLVKESTYYVAAMAAFGVITACFNNIAISITIQRDAGILKRANGTPLPNSAFLVARVVHAVFLALLLVVITAAFGRVLYSAQVPTGVTLIQVLVMLAVGAASFCTLALALTAAIPNADAANAVVFATIMPLLFLSGIFIPFGYDTPSWIQWIARLFPVRHFAAGLQAGFLGTPFDWSDVAVVAAWGLVGLLAGDSLLPLATAHDMRRDEPGRGHGRRGEPRGTATERCELVRSSSACSAAATGPTSPRVQTWTRIRTRSGSSTTRPSFGPITVRWVDGTKAALGA